MNKYTVQTTERTYRVDNCAEVEFTGDFVFFHTDDGMTLALATCVVVSVEKVKDGTNT